MDKNNPEMIKMLNKNNILPNKNISKIRFNILDNIKGILIFLVVFAHFLFNYAQGNIHSFVAKIVNFIYCFHMPSFIFWSGFLSKSENSKNLKNITKLILIYIIFNYSHGFILYIYCNIPLNFFYPYNSYWYLLCLIFWRFSINYFSNQYFSIIISFIISILIGFWSEITTIFSIKRSFSFYPYFLVGYKFSKDNFIKIIHWRKKFYFIFVCLFCIFIFISFQFLPFIEIKHSMMNNNYDDIKEDLKQRIKLFLFSFLIIFFGILVISNNKIIILTNAGKNSLYIYLFHRIITILIDKELFKRIKYNPYIILYIV